MLVLEKNVSDIYKNLANFSNIMRRKYKESPSIKIPHCNSDNELMKWIFSALEQIHSYESEVYNVYNKGGKYELKNLSYQEVVILFYFILTDRKKMVATSVSTMSQRTNCSAYLLSILKTGVIWGSDSKGFIKGPNPAACFMDVPFMSLKYILNNENCDPGEPRYEPFGIFINKKYAYKHGCRPVLYLSNNEVKKLNVPNDELWRVVRFEVSNSGWISWIHEREWRCKGNLKL